MNPSPLSREAEGRQNRPSPALSSKRGSWRGHAVSKPDHAAQVERVGSGLAVPVHIIDSQVEGNAPAAIRIKPARLLSL